MALIALQNLNQQLHNQWEAINAALAELSLNTFLNDDFFPTPRQGFDLTDALTGLGTIFSVVSGFVPLIGPGLAAAGAILPTVGSYLGDAVGSKADRVLVGQKDFVEKVKEVYRKYVNALDLAGTKLFEGESIQTATSSFNITDMMHGGV